MLFIVHDNHERCIAKIIDLLRMNRKSFFNIGRELPYIVRKQTPNDHDTAEFY